MADDSQLCNSCVKVDLFSLFTGPRYYPGEGYDARVRAEVGTLQEVKTNARCPLCRLIKHDLYGQDSSHPWEYYGDECDPSKVRCALVPVRIDYYEDTKYLHAETKAMLATRVEVRLFGMTGCSEEESHLIERHSRGSGIQLLSPGSVDPARPLLNGFRATTMENSLALLSRWIKTCHEHHNESCQFEKNTVSQFESRPYRIRVIDIWERKLVDYDPTCISYAALSYVWGQDKNEYTKLADELQLQRDGAGNESTFLPPAVPKVIEDALLVCKALSIPYLWVDLYCIHQSDPVQKSIEINNMGFIYSHSHITLVAGSTAARDDLETGGNVHPGLLPALSTSDLGSRQIIETIGNRQYISALPSIFHQIISSAWCKRGWTFQEGQMASRIAFFGEYDVSFMCGAGHWREALHSGKFGHDARISDLDLRSEGYYTLSALGWQRTAEWDFSAYDSIVLEYSHRKLSNESDRLDAISGCLNILAQQKGTRFLYGLPSADFHYALIWNGEEDRPRAGFPSWSWAGWHAMNQTHCIFPNECLSGSLSLADDGDFEYVDQKAPDIELQGFLIRGAMESQHQKNKCSQRLATLSVSISEGTIIVRSQVAKFSVDITATPAPREDALQGWGGGGIPADFDTTSGHYSADWDADTEYRRPYRRLRLQDSSGNTYAEASIDTHLRSDAPQPWFGYRSPMTLRGSTLTRLLRDGIELINIVEVKVLEAEKGLNPFHLVFCLGIDRSEGIPGGGRRMGVWYLPKEAWDKARPTEMEVKFW